MAAILSAVAAPVLATSCGGSKDTPTNVHPPAVASVVIEPDSVLLIPGRNAQLSVSVRDAAGVALTGRSVTWSSADNSKVTVTQTGQVTAIALGRVVITATSEGKSGTTVMVVSSSLGREFSIVGAQFTQGVQDAAGSIPMVLSGSAAAVNILVQASPPSTTPMQLVLRLLDAAGTVVYSDTAATRAALGATPTYLSPSAQFLVPNARITSGLRWQVVRDPRGVVADDDLSNDVYPRAAPQALTTVSVPALNIRFVPIVLASNNNATPSLSEAGLTEYLRTVRSIHPVGVVNAHIGASYTTTASFGTPPSGGESSFWTTLLSELDLARIADPTESTINWYGVVSPPSGFTFTSYGGFSYIPTSGTNTGPRTRTSVGVRTGWFNQATQARDLVAHELAHTFGRNHAPCGAAGAPLDAAYPVAGGVLDVPGHDVYSWANLLATAAVVVPSNTGDVMGYCFPVWASTYTYKAILQFRQPTVIAARTSIAAGDRARVLVVRGVIDNEQTIKLEPAFTLIAHPTAAEPGDDYRVEGLAANGRVLFSSSFSPATIDHAPREKHFTVAVPMEPELEEQLADIRVIGPAGQARIVRGGTLATGAPAEARVSAVRRLGNSATTVSCSDPTSRGVLILDDATGAVLGSASRASMDVPLTPGSAVAVLCSDGVQTRRARVVAPR